jgi:hypothetical protein
LPVATRAIAGISSRAARRPRHVVPPRRGVQPNYLFTLQEDAAKIRGTGQSYAEQYVLGKLDVEQAHRAGSRDQ